jgi:hypothetical protein
MSLVTRLLTVSIASQMFAGSVLRLDGSGVTQPVGPGAGIVNCQNGVGPYETLIIEDHPANGTFSILSSEFPDVYVRMDCTGMVPGASYPNGVGTVNLQYTAGPYEQFSFVPQSDGTKAIASVQFPGCYLRMSNPGSQGGGSGTGTVNGQNSIGPYEKFFIDVI